MLQTPLSTGDFSESGHPTSRPLFDRIGRFFADESGPTAVEYAVMLALILAVVLISVQVLGITTFGMFTTIGTKMP